MSYGHWLLKALCTVGLIGALGTSMNADASFLGFGGTSWKEEVLLHDGSKIIVKRSLSYGGRHEIGQPSAIKEQTIAFTLPGTNQSIQWTSKYSEDIGRADFGLLALHVLKGTPYIVTQPIGCLASNKWGRPNPPYVFFKYDGKEWQRIPLEEFPVEFKTLNVAIYLGGQDVEAMVSLGLVPAEKIRELNSNLLYNYPQYRSILREAMPKVQCRVEFSNGKGTWLSIDWFRDEKDLAACIRVCELKGFEEATCPCGQIFKGK